MVSEVDVPGILLGLYSLAGQQIPRLTPMSGAGNHQPQRGHAFGMTDRKGQNSDRTSVPGVRVIDRLLVPRSLASCDLPGRHLLAVVCKEVVTVGPAQDEADVVVEEKAEPVRSGIASIEDMQHLPLPLLGAP